ncbi:MAG TPA: response regulator, partial [Gammaproteobacteria bacterium]|nr:response regulator [Gammaproteobacteria bacterium]
GITLAPDICISKPVRQQQLSDALRLARRPRVAMQPGGRADAAVAPAQPAGSRQIAGLEVLVVDDNAINREVAAAMLEERGCRVTLAQDGAEAVVHATQRRFDLILMDCQMPGLDGYAATENIRREELGQGHRPSLIVALTANVLPRDRERCLSAGMNDVLIKPFSGAQLETILLRAEHERAPGTPADLHAASTADAGEEPDTVSIEALVESDFEPIEIELFGAGPSAASPQPAPPILDATQIDAIRSLSKPRLLEQMCAIFIAEAPTALRSIEDGLARGDLTTVRTAAHALRSSASNLGGRRFAALLERCETAASEGELAAARQAGAQLRAAYGCLEEALRELTERRTGT